MELVNHSNTQYAPNTQLLVKLVTKLNILSSLLSKNGVIVQASSEHGEQSFLKLSLPNQEMIYKHVCDYLEIVSAIPDITESPTQYPTYNKEIKCLDMALKKFNLTPKDDCQQYLTKGDIVEIYSAEGVQLYRNFEFFKNCSYSLMDVITNEWFVLYERPQQIIDTMINICSQVLKSGKETVQYAVPEHILRERYLNAKRAFKIVSKYISPLVDSNGQTTAVLTVLTVLTADLISTGDETLKIHMI